MDEPSNSPAKSNAIAWYRTTLAIAMVGSLLMWAAQPPLGWGFVGWIAPVPWLILVAAPQLAGKRAYCSLWLAGFVFWLLCVYWLTLPHPATSLGWLALSAYLGCYLPVFVALARVGVHRLRLPLWIVAPVVWTGLELARAHLLTGFLMGSLSHTQVHWTAVIQVSDLVGQYGVDFLMMMVASCLVAAWNPAWPAPVVDRRSHRPLALVPGVVVLTACVAYGHWRLAESITPPVDPSRPTGARIALVQGNTLADWKQDAEKQRRIMESYIGLSHSAVNEAKSDDDARPLGVIVWPETMFRTGLTTFGADYQLPPDASFTLDQLAAAGPNDLKFLVEQLDTPLLVGIDRVHFLAGETTDAPSSYHAYNSAVLVAREGQIVGIYDKVHRVMFGEYIPLGDWLPWLYWMTPLTGGIQAGSEPMTLEIDGVRYAPNICYESVLPHVIRYQVATLSAAGQRPDVLVNLTNDAWFWGTAELDQHLACDMFRAVECRTPLLAAANGGLSASIDRWGRVLDVAPRQQEAVILADVEFDPRMSFYAATGDWFAGACLIGCLLLAGVGVARRKVSPENVKT